MNTCVWYFNCSCFNQLWIEITEYIFFSSSGSRTIMIFLIGILNQILFKNSKPWTKQLQSLWNI